MAPGYVPNNVFDPRIDDFEPKDRRYLHFDNPLSEIDRENFSITEKEISQHAFWPLIGYLAEERRVKKKSDGSLEFNKKDRPIKFGSHKDAAILQYYAKSLSLDYENYLQNFSYRKSILAYRANIGNNITHSKELFDEIRGYKNCTAIALDISGFFNNIDHKVLYNLILRMRNVSRLPEADFKIFRRMTHFEWVESDCLKARLGSKYGRNNRICYAKDFRDLVRARSGAQTLINYNDHPYGIPQGTPLSGLYANISLIDFDAEVSDFVASLNGSYRRYSDDLAIVIPDKGTTQKVIKFVEYKLSKINLEISHHKTDISHFKYKGTELISDKPFQYLGFTFDGKVTLIRQSSLNRYYTKMNRGIRAKVLAAKKLGVQRKNIYLRDLYKRYTHFGKYRNFPRYAYRSSEIHQSPEIKKQMRRHMLIFRKMLSNSIESIYN